MPWTFKLNGNEFLVSFDAIKSSHSVILIWSQKLREMMVVVAIECRISKTKARPIAWPTANCDNSRFD